VGESVILLIIGLASGIISGMGIGGGTILIPALFVFINPEQHIAQSVNLLFFIPTAIIALIVHIGKRRIDFKTAIPIIISGFIGAYIGSETAVMLPGNYLKKIFAVFLLGMGIYEVFVKGGKKKRQS
jgi:uncharacterized protein